MAQQPFGYVPYEPPRSQAGRPAVITWFRIYSATTVLFYLSFFAIWQFMAPSGKAGGRHGHMEPTQLGFLVGIGLFVLLFGGLFAVGALVPYKPWGWVVGLVAICLGLSGCLAPFAIPLLIFWMKPETKAAFGRL
jgi:hypothetical protein